MLINATQKSRYIKHEMYLFVTSAYCARVWQQCYDCVDLSSTATPKLTSCLGRNAE